MLSTHVTNTRPLTWLTSGIPRHSRPVPARAVVTCSPRWCTSQVPKLVVDTKDHRVMCWVES